MKEVGFGLTGLARNGGSWFGLTGMAGNGGSWFLFDWNDLEYWKSALARLEWLRTVEVLFLPY
jgi:hypothetical protein